MSVSLAIRSGALAGRTLSFDRDMFSVGRSPDCDLVFDAHKDIDVSSRHAEFVTIGPRTVLRDLGSTNGTWLNGARIASDAEIYSGDTITFGEHGPVADVTIAGGNVRPTAAPATRVSSGARASGGARVPDSAPVDKPTPPVARGAPVRSTQMKINAAVEITTKKMQRTLVVVAVVLGAAGIAAYLYGRSQSAAEIKTMMAMLDSADAQIKAARSKSSQMDSAMAAQQQAMASLRAQIGRGGNEGEIAALSQRLSDAQRRASQMVVAAGMDHEAIYNKNGKAVALIIVEMPNGEKSAATAFSVDAKGVLVTNRHAVKDLGSGAIAKRIAVLFNDTQGWQPAHVVRVNEGDDDLAVLQMDRPGPYPMVAGIASAGEAPRPGQPIAFIGYPLGIDIGVEGGLRGTARATINPGTVSKVIDKLTQIDGYAAQGSSGSPMFNAQGLVIGVVYGGPTDAQGKIVYAVPLARVLAELRK